MPLVIVGDPYSVTITGDPSGADLAIAPGGGSISASGAVTFAAMAADGAAGLGRLADGAALFGAMTADGASIVTRPASGAVTFAAMGVDGAASLAGQVAASGNVRFGAMTADGAAVLARVVSGAPVFAAMRADGLASLAFEASGDAVFAAMRADGVAAREVVADGAVAFAAMTADGASLLARLPRVASGAATFGAMTVGATAQREIGTSGAVAFGAMTVGSTAQREIISDAAISFAAMTADGAATVMEQSVISAGGAVIFAAMTADGDADVSSGGGPLTVEATATGQHSGTNTTTHTISMPAGIEAGDILVALFSCDGTATHTPSAGWTQLATAVRSTNVRGSAFWKVAAGSDTLTVTTSAGEASSHIVYRISGAGISAPDVATANGFGVPDAPSLSPAGGSAEYLWIAAAMSDGQSTVNAAPADFGGLLTVAHSNSYGASIGATHRIHTASTLDPAAFGAGGSQNNVTMTIAVRAA